MSDWTQAIEKPGARRRARHGRDAAWLRRARMRYALLVRPWVEGTEDHSEFRARLYCAAERAIERGFYARSTAERQAMIGLLTKWRGDDKMPWWPWMHADKRRASVVDWGIKTSWIKRDARRLVG